MLSLEVSSSLRHRNARLRCDRIGLRVDPPGLPTPRWQIRAGWTAFVAVAAATGTFIAWDAQLFLEGVGASLALLALVWIVLAILD